MHTIWKGKIQFGLVNIPIRLHAATEDKDIKLKLLHRRCGSPINYKKVCSQCNQEVANDELAKAYEYAPGKFILLDEEELERLKRDQEDKTVAIQEFVNLDEIDPIYFHKSYYLSPDDGGEKGYHLLRQALQDSKRIGLAKIVIRDNEQLAAIRPLENTIVLETLFFPDEIRDISDVPNIPEVMNSSEQELATAKLLVDHLTVPFNPGKYKDDYRISLLELIESKMANTRPSAPNNVLDLMAALQASVEATKPKRRKRVSKVKEEKEA